MALILGILSVWQGEDRNDRPFGLQTSLFEAISHAGKSFGFRTCVYIPQVIGKKEKLKCFTLMNGKWSRVLEPMPNVVYDRLPSRQVENDPRTAEFREALFKNTGGRYFNRAGFFSKSQIYLLTRDILPKDLHIPETDVNPSPEKSIRLIDLWGEAWLKPDDGSLGQGIYRLLREPFGIAIESSDQGSTEQLKHSEALEFLEKHLSTKRYILQRGIPRALKNFRPYDIRVYLQKNRQGKFIITKQFARLANFGQIVSNLDAGGDSIPLTGLLSQTEHSNLRTLSLTAANRLNQVIPGPLGELGLDVILDDQRRFWLIEINSKPFLKMEPDDPYTRITAMRTVAYAKFLLTGSKTHKLNREHQQIIPRSAPKPSQRVSKDR